MVLEGKSISFSSLLGWKKDSFFFMVLRTSGDMFMLWPYYDGRFRDHCIIFF